MSADLSNPSKGARFSCFGLLYVVILNSFVVTVSFFVVTVSSFGFCFITSAFKLQKKDIFSTETFDQLT